MVKARSFSWLQQGAVATVALASLALGALGCDGILSIQDLTWNGVTAADGGGDGGAGHADSGHASKDAAKDSAAGDGSGLQCGAGTSLCGNECVEEQSDPGNCGACGKKCGSGLVCSAGSCQVSCAMTLTECHTGSHGDAGSADGGVAVCADVQRDPENCGSCGNVCTGGQVCASGKCSVACPGSEVDCGSACVDPATSNQFCGATAGCGASGGSAGSICGTGSVCGGGTCGTSCVPGEVNCGGTCVDPTTSNQFCGASGACTGTSVGAQCQPGYVCAGGACSISCLDGEVECSGTCVNPLTSNQFCGATGNCTGTSAGAVCAAGQVCAAGTCGVSCPSGEVDCNGTCINPTASNQYCGASGSCTGASAGAVCPSGDVCINGSCSANCGGANIACGGTCVDPTESNRYCGASGNCQGANAGTTCGLQEACVSGTCSVLAISCTGAPPPAPVFTSVWPATTGWTTSTGAPISLTIQNAGLGVPTTYECRTGPIATVGNLPFTECDGGMGTGLTYTPAPDNANGEHRTDVRVRTSTTCAGATTSYSFYVHTSLNHVAACAAPGTPAQIFAEAATYLPATGTFGAATQLATPFVNFAFTTRTASVLSLRHTFAMNPAGTMVAMWRSFQSTKTGTCGQVFRQGDLNMFGSRIYPECSAIVFAADGSGVCLGGTGGALTFVHMFSNVNARLSGPAARASNFSDRPFSQKSRTIQNDSHWLYLPD